MTWIQPATLPEALALLAAGGTPVGGGAALLSLALPPAMGERAIDLRPVLPAGVDGDRIGAGTLIATLAHDRDVRRRWPALAGAAAATATPQVRAVATLGGTLAARLPTADLPASLAAHGAVVTLIRAGDGVPVDVPVVEYLSDPFPVAHLVTGIRLTVSAPGGHARFALRTGPAPAIAVVAGIRTPEGFDLWAGAVGQDAAPIRFEDGAVPAVARLRDDARASASYRARLLSALAADIRTELCR